MALKTVPELTAEKLVASQLVQGATLLLKGEGWPITENPKISYFFIV